MSTLHASADVRSAELRAVVIRCGCGDPEAHPGTPCPAPRAIEDHGTIAYYHRSPWKRLAWRVGRWFRRR